MNRGSSGHQPRFAVIFESWEIRAGAHVSDPERGIDREGYKGSFLRLVLKKGGFTWQLVKWKWTEAVLCPITAFPGNVMFIQERDLTNLFCLHLLSLSLALGWRWCRSAELQRHEKLAGRLAGLLPVLCYYLARTEYHHKYTEFWIKYKTSSNGSGSSCSTRTTAALWFSNMSGTEGRKIQSNSFN